MEKTVEWFTSERGECEALGFVRQLPAEARRAIGEDLRVLQRQRRVDADLAHQMQGDLWVLRTRWAGVDYRLLYFVEGGRVLVVTAGFLKKTQKDPAAEIQKSLARMREWRRRRREGRSVGTATVPHQPYTLDDWLAEEEARDPTWKEKFEAGLPARFLGNDLTVRRQDLGLKQAELAERSGIPQSMIRRIERGHAPSLRTHCRLALALDAVIVIRPDGKTMEVQAAESATMEAAA